MSSALRVIFCILQWLICLELKPLRQGCYTLLIKFGIVLFFIVNFTMTKISPAFVRLMNVLRHYLPFHRLFFLGGTVYRLDTGLVGSVLVTQLLGNLINNFVPIGKVLRYLDACA